MGMPCGTFWRNFKVPPTLGRLFALWLALGAQSFGGGTTTLFLIRRAFVEQRGWVGENEFSHDWALCQVSPGIKLLALTTLIGRRLAGWPGVGVSLAGLLLPSAAITVALTAGYARVRDLPAMQAALRGVVPATVGLGLLTAWQVARPLVRESQREGRASLLASVLLLGVAGALAQTGRVPVLALLLGGGAVGALVYGRRPVAVATHDAPPTEERS